jgi:membrane-bound inhibitor of C-type lysozyme
MSVKKITPTQILLLIIAALLFVIALSLLSMKKSPANAPILTPAPINNISYSCAGNKTIKALYYGGDKVELSLEDGRTFNLETAISASGARYTNDDESFVFWSKGSTAFVTEKGKTTFSDCVSQN